MSEPLPNTPDSEATIAAAPEAPTIDPEKAKAVFEKLTQQQNFVLGITGGFVAAIIGAVAWAAVTISTGYQIGWMAVGIGFLVGFVIRFLGKGLTAKFGVAGGVLALFGCLLGNLLAMGGLIAKEGGEEIIPTCLAILTNPPVAIEVMIATFSPMDLLFYGIAVYEGYKFSFREITDQDLSEMV